MSNAKGYWEAYEAAQKKAQTARKNQTTIAADLS